MKVWGRLVDVLDHLEEMTYSVATRHGTGEERCVLESRFLVSIGNIHGNAGQRKTDLKGSVRMAGRCRKAGVLEQGWVSPAKTLATR